MAGEKNLLLLLAVFFSAAVSEPDSGDKDFVQWYEQGKKAYLDEYWQDCIDSMQKSSDAFKEYRKAVVQCRIRCKREADSAQPLSTALSTEDLGFYERQVRATLCLLKCRKKNGLVKVYKRSELESFELLAPYDYMQLCYFQVYTFSGVSSTLNYARRSNYYK